MQLTKEEYLHRLEENLDKKITALGEILELSFQQQEAIDAENDDALNALIEKKQLEIDAIQAVDAQFEVYFNRLKSLLGVESLDAVSSERLPEFLKVKQGVASVMELLQQIQWQEAINHQKMQDVFSHLKENMKQVKATKVANKAYLGPKTQETASYFIDSRK